MKPTLPQTRDVYNDLYRCFLPQVDTNDGGKVTRISERARNCLSVVRYASGAAACLCRIVLTNSYLVSQQYPSGLYRMFGMVCCPLTPTRTGASPQPKVTPCLKFTWHGAAETWLRWNLSGSRSPLFLPPRGERSRNLALLCRYSAAGRWVRISHR